MRISTRAALPFFSLIYVVEAMLHVEVEVSSIGVLLKSKLD
jgi:hypothetical protein